jgi:hypothetical protein
MRIVQAVLTIMKSADTLLQAQNLTTKGLWAVSHARSEILTAALLKIQVFFDVTQCHWMCSFQNSDGTRIFRMSKTTQPMIQHHIPMDLNLQLLLSLHIQFAKFSCCCETLNLFTKGSPCILKWGKVTKWP